MTKDALPNATITFLIEYDKRFLLICRSASEQNFADLWAFPGGKVELGETAIQTIVREVKEETNLDLSDHGAFLDSYFFKKTVGFAFLVRAEHDNVVPATEIAAYRWVRSTDEMIGLRCIPGIFNHLERAIEILKAGRLDRLSRMNLTPDIYINS